VPGLVEFLPEFDECVAYKLAVIDFLKYMMFGPKAVDGRAERPCERAFSRARKNQKSVVESEPVRALTDTVFEAQSPKVAFACV
jgi:hypothetical protein